MLPPKFQPSFLLIILVFSPLFLSAQQPGQIVSVAGFNNACINGVTNILDPNGDCAITNNFTGEFTGGGFEEILEFEELASNSDLIVPWTALRAVDPEPSGDPVNGGSCNNTDIVSDGNTPNSHTYYTVFKQSSIDYIGFRIRIADKASGNFGFSVLVDTDGFLGQFGSNSDPNYVCGNAGFEREVVLATGGSPNNKGVSIYDVDGKNALANNAPKIGGRNFPNNWNVSYAAYNDPNCNGNQPVFYTFFLELSLLNTSVLPNNIAMISGSSTSGGSALSSNGSDIGGLSGNGINDPCDCATQCASVSGCSLCITDCQQTCLGNPTPTLPVEWTDFSAEYGKQGIKLDWTVAQEKSNDYFVIERSVDNKLYQAIGDIAGRGTANSSHTYQFLDLSIQKQDHYYRIKQVDFNGSFTYSSVVLLKPVDLGPNGFVVQKSATTPPILNWFSPEKSLIKVSILNMQAQVLSVKYLDTKQGHSLHSLDMPTLPKGIYLLRVADERYSSIFVHRIIL